MLCIRPFRPDDTPSVAELILAIQQQEFGVPITLADQPDLQAIQAFYQQGAGQFWVALWEGQLVGTVALLDIGQRQGALRKMFVAASHRGGAFGVAPQLLATLVGWARQHQLRELFLGTTDRFHAAHRFYEKHGFQEVPAHQLPAHFPVMKVDSKFYRMELASR